MRQKLSKKIDYLLKGHYDGCGYGLNHEVASKHHQQTHHNRGQDIT